MIGVCITARNEEETIGSLVQNLSTYRVYVVNDGSTDLTGWMAWKFGATVIKHTQSQGIGPSLMEAWRRALGDGCERITQLDAGGSHNPKDLIGLLAINADVVIGSRFLPGSDYRGRSFRRRMSRLASAMCNFAQSGANHTDWTSGYRVFSREAIERLLKVRYQARMHGWQIEVLAWVGHWGLSIAEMPISYFAGASTFNLRVANEAFGVWLSILNNLSVCRS